MTDKTMDFKIYPARVEGEPELMNKPLTPVDFSSCDEDISRDLIYKKVQSAKRGLVKEIDQASPKPSSAETGLFYMKVREAINRWLNIPDGDSK